MSDRIYASEYANTSEVIGRNNLRSKADNAVSELSLSTGIVPLTISLLVLPTKSRYTAQVKKSWIDFIHKVIGEPNYCFTITLNPVLRSRSTDTKINDARQAMAWFVCVLNTNCFGHGYRRKGIELGFFATLEGLGACEQPHWHGAIRLPKQLSNEKFLLAFDAAMKKTKRFGRQFDLVPYYDKRWLEYSIKTGANSVHPEFLRPGTP